MGEELKDDVEFVFDGEEFYNEIVDFLGECSNSELVNIYNSIFHFTKARFSEDDEEMIEVFKYTSYDKKQQLKGM